MHQDNPLAQNMLSVKCYFPTRATPVLEDAPYAADLAPSNIFLFQKIKSVLKGTQFESMEEVKQKLEKLRNVQTKEDFWHCFDQWKNE